MKKFTRNVVLFQFQNKPFMPDFIKSFRKHKENTPKVRGGWGEVGDWYFLVIYEKF